MGVVLGEPSDKLRSLEQWTREPLVLPSSRLADPRFEPVDATLVRQAAHLVLVMVYPNGNEHPVTWSSCTSHASATGEWVAVQIRRDPLLQGLNPGACPFCTSGSRDI